MQRESVSSAPTSASRASTTTTPARNCTPCAPLRARSEFAASGDGCSWACVPGHTLRANATHPDAMECVPDRPNAVRCIARRDVRLACAESEFRVNDFECRPCDELGVATPAPEGLGVR